MAYKFTGTAWLTRNNSSKKLRQAFCNDFTLAVRVKLTQNPSSSAGAYLLQLDDAGSPSTQCYIHYDDSNRVIVASGGENAPGHVTKFARTTGYVTLNKWVTVVGRQEAADTVNGLSVWVNETEAATTAPWNNDGGGFAQRVIIGGAAGHYQVAEASVWRGPISDTDIVRFSRGTPAHEIRPDLLINCWRLDSNEKLIRDSAPGSGIHLTRQPNSGFFVPDPFTRADRKEPKIKRARKLRRRISPGTVTKYRGAKSVGEILNHRVRLNVTSPQAERLVRWWPFAGANEAVRGYDHSPKKAGYLTRVPTSGYPLMRPTPQHGRAWWGNPSGGGGYSSDARVLSSDEKIDLQGTVSVWMRGALSTSTEMILGNADWSTGRNGIFFYGRSNIASTITLCSASASLSQDSSLTGAQAGGPGWRHITATWDGVTLRIYDNGRQTGSRAQTLTPVTDVNAFRIGETINASRPFTGQIRDLRVYNRCLSAREVYALYDPRTRYDLFLVPDHSAVRSIPKMGFFKRSRGARTLSEIL